MESVIYFEIVSVRLLVSKVYDLVWLSQELSALLKDLTSALLQLLLKFFFDNVTQGI